VGRGMREFKETLQGGDDYDEPDEDPPTAKPVP
jgi:hypothetical protein